MTAEEADSEMQNTTNLSQKERLKIAMYLNSVAFNFSIDSPPKLDRSAFGARSRS